ncbi:MAG: hypothetical protein ACNA74_07770 [Desulfurivibrio sp.]
MKVKGYLKGITLGLMGCGIIATGAMAANDESYAEFTVDSYSQYIWRGYAFSRDSVVVQPSMTMGWRGFSANIWGNLDTNPWGGEKATWNETDLTLAYDWELADFAFSTGYIYYGLEGADDSQEIYLGATYDTLLEPTLTVYRDFASYPGWYVTLGIGHSLPLGGDLSLDLAAQAGYVNSDNYKAMHDGLLSASISVPVGDNFTITPIISYSFALSSKAKDELRAANLAAIDKEKSDFVYGGISLGMAF